MEKLILTVNDCFMHDSGDCLEWTKKMIENFKKYGIDKSTKTLIIETPIVWNKDHTMNFVNIAKVKSILNMTKDEKIKVNFIQ